MGPFIRQQDHGLLHGCQHIPGKHQKLGKVPAQGVCGHPIHGGGGHHTGEGVVQSGGQGVDIGPGAGAAPLGVLLQRAEAAFGYLHGRCAGVDIQVLGSAQIQDLHGAVGLQHQVIGAQVPMDKPCFVDLCHSVCHRQKNLLCLLPGHGALLSQPLLQGLAFHKVHDDVGGGIFLKHLQHVDDLGNIGDQGHFPGFLLEGFHAAVLGKPGRIR